MHFCRTVLISDLLDDLHLLHRSNRRTYGDMMEAKRRRRWIEVQQMTMMYLKQNDFKSLYYDKWYVAFNWNSIRTPLNLFYLPEPEEHERFLIDDVCCKNTQSILVFNCSWRTILMESTFCNLHYNQLFITILEREFAKTIQPDIFNCYLPLGTLSTLGLPFPQWAIHWSLRRLCHMY